MIGLSHPNESKITSLMNAALNSIHDLVHIEADKPSLMQAPLMQTDYGVLIGILGDLRGRLFILGEAGVFAHAGQTMYGVALEGDMLESFVGEFGNSVAGHTATRLYDQTINIDITPPTTMQGTVKLGGFSTALSVGFTLNGAKGQLVLAMEDEK